MLNLLPPEEKKLLGQEEQLKIVINLGILISAVLTSLILVLFSLKIFISADLESQKIIFEQREKELSNQRVKEIEKDVKNYNSNLSRIQSFYREQISLTEVLREITKTVPVGAYLTNLNFNSLDAKFSLSGKAGSREVLLLLKNNLEKEEIFSDINFPSASWVEPLDINFNLSFKLEKNVSKSEN